MMQKYFFILLIFTIFVGCSSDEDSVGSEQVADIESYLDDNDLTFTIINGVYRVERDEYLSTITIEAGDIELAVGDSIYINYVSQIFDSEPDGVYDTNIEEIAEYIDFLPTDKVYEPFGIKYGSTDIISGLYSGLRGVKQGDKISLFMPFMYAYGDNYMGILDKESAINIDIDVVKIVRQ